ncbi:hypothetical protein SKAU_G00223210 [Synaphobranchus kaupii]|uniref:Ig-like domain-containing protein n=1 Tax=Synaphobranchus kaupii TaxID=118154 RepID=A0A9Q1IVP9_SYNKA|nr:hypothetical protein SKAU_G00223210 [Synaphobranchus kaupii]
MEASSHSAWLVLILTAGALSVIFPQSIAAFPDTRGPYFTKIEGPDTLTAGESTDFTCAADCTPPCTYTWSVAGQTVEGRAITVTADGLTSSVDLECTSINPKSNETSSTSRKLKVKNPVSVKPSAGKEPTLNQPFSVTCAGSGQMSTIEWYKGGDILALDAQMTLSADNSTLSFSSLLPSHGGFYQCVSSKSNKRIISVGYLLIYGSLSVNISGPGTVEVGKEHAFECQTSCEIGCSISWTFRGGFPSGSFTQRQTVITWTPDTPNTTQIFTCVVENTSALKSATATKLVRVKPEKKVRPESGSMALKPSTALCLAVCIVLLSLGGL